MPAPAAIAGTFADLKFLKSRSVIQIVIETAIENGPAVVAAFGTPQPGAEVHVAVARIDPKAAERAAEKPRERKPWAELSRAQQAGIRCGEPSFKAFLAERYWGALEAAGLENAACVRALCKVTSRADLDDPDRPARGKSWDALDEQYRSWLYDAAPTAQREG
jgi:hypothetical protein